MTVTLAASDSVLQFVVAGLIPLVLGLSLAVFGVALAVGAFKPQFVRTVAVWCVLGTVGMLVLVVLTLVGMTGRVPTLAVFQSEALLSNFVIGGSVGGTLTGVYAGIQAQQEQSVREHSNRLVMVNRLLKDEVVNAMFAIDGYADVVEDGTGDADRLIEIIRDKSTKVQRTVDDVKHLSRTTDQADLQLEPVSIRTHIEAAVETVSESHPDSDVSLSLDVADDVTVWADTLLERVVWNLIDNAVRHSESATPTVDVAVTANDDTVAVSISDDGPGLPPSQQALLEDGEITEYDDPTTGFGLSMVRFLAESYGAAITTTIDDSGTTVTLTLQRDAGSRPPLRTSLTDLRSYGIAPARLGVATGGAVVASIVMGLVMQTLDGTVPVIGALYGVANPLIGWLTHVFHSVVFGMLYTVLLTMSPDRYTNMASRRVGLSVAWGVSLWFVAAGFVMPIWLRLLGIETPLPNLTASSLLGHLLWGLVLGGAYELGCRGVGFASE